jgi:hypothetical protein
VKCFPAFGSAAQNTLAVPHRLYSLSGRLGLPGAIGLAGLVMQRDRFFIETNYRFSWIIRPFIYFQHVLHPFQILVGQVGHAPHFFPATV